MAKSLRIESLVRPRGRAGDPILLPGSGFEPPEGCPGQDYSVESIDGILVKTPRSLPLAAGALASAIATSNTVHGKDQGMQQNGEIHEEASMADIVKIILNVFVNK